MVAFKYLLRDKQHGFQQFQGNVYCSKHNYVLNWNISIMYVWDSYVPDIESNYTAVFSYNQETFVSKTGAPSLQLFIPHCVLLWLEAFKYILLL